MTLLVLIALLILANALYVAAEFSAVSVRSSRIEQLATEGDARAKRLHPVVADSKKLDEYVAACQVGITLSSLLLGVVGQARLADHVRPFVAEFGQLQEFATQSVSTTITLLSLTALQVIVGELFPKSLALRSPAKVAMWTTRPMTWSLILFRIPILILNGSGNALLRLVGFGHERSHHALFSPDELRTVIIESQREGELQPKESALLQNVLRFSRRRARESMVPRTRVMGVDIQTGPAESARLMVESPYSRFPVYRDSLDNITGFVHVKDLVTSQAALSSRELEEFLRPVISVPGTVEAGELLRRMQREQVHMAVVLDEFGGTAGLVTLEDLIEEVVGEVQDEFDEEIPPFRRMKDGRVRLRGDVAVSDANEQFRMGLDGEHVSTLSGYVMARLGRAPTDGDRITEERGLLEVRSVDDEDQLILMWTPTTATHQEDEDDEDMEQEKS